MSATLHLQHSLWRDVLMSLSLEERDSHKLTVRQRIDLGSDLAYAQSRVRYFERALELESTKAEIAEMKALARVDLA